MIIASLIARLEADPTNMIRNVTSGGRAIDKLESTIDKAGKSIDSTMRKIERSVERVASGTKKLDGSAKSSLDAAGRSADKMGRNVEKAAGGAERALDRQTKSADRARDAMGRFVSGSHSGPGGGLNGVAKSIENIERQTGKANVGFGGMLSTTLKIGAAIGVMKFFSEAVGGISSAVLGYNQNLEQSMIGMTTMLGSAEKAKGFMAQLQDFAAHTPFDFQGIVAATQSMMALGFSAEDVLPNLTAVGDATAALGGNMNDMGARVIRALGQMQAKGKVSAEEMMQLAEAGIPAWRYLAEAIGQDVPTAMETAKKKGVASAVAIDAIMKGMESDFGGMMDAQSKTMMGSWSTVLDYLQMNVAKATKPFYDVIKGGILKAAEWLGSDEAAKFATQFTDKVTNAFETASEVVSPFIDQAVELFTDLIAASKDLGAEMEPTFRVIGASIVIGLDALSRFIDLLDSAVDLIHRNETVAKALAIAITAVVASMAAGKVTSFWSSFLGGAKSAYSSMTNFFTLNQRGMAMMKDTSNLGVQRLKAMEEQAAITGQSVTAQMRLASGSATGFAGAVKNAGSNLLSAFGGPAGIAVTATIALVAWKLNEAAKKAQVFEERVSAMEAAFISAAKTAGGEGLPVMPGSGNRLKLLTEKLYPEGGDGKYKDLTKTMRQYGLVMSDLFDVIDKGSKPMNVVDKLMDKWGSTGKGGGEKASEWSDAFSLLAKNGWDAERAIKAAGTGPAGSAIKVLNTELRSMHMTMASFGSSSFGQALSKMFKDGVPSGMDDYQLNHYVDTMVELRKAYAAGTLGAREFTKAQKELEDQIAKDAAAKKNAAATGAGDRSMFDSFKMSDKEQAKALEGFDDYVLKITETWQKMDLKSLSDQMGLDAWEQDAKMKLAVIAGWTKNLESLMVQGLSQQALSALMEGGPQQYAKMVDELVKKPKDIWSVNQLFADTSNMSNDVAKLKRNADLVAVALSPNSNLGTMVQWAQENVVDLFAAIGDAPQMVKDKFTNDVAKIGEGIKGMFSGVKDITGWAPNIDWAKVKQEQDTLTHWFDALMATDLKFTADFEVDPARGERTIREAIETAARTPIDQPMEFVGSDGKPASDVFIQTIRQMVEYVRNTHPELNLGAKHDAADDVVLGLIKNIGASEGVLPIIADPTQGESALEAFAYEMNKKTGEVKIDGDTIPADNELAKLVKKVGGETGTIMLDANQQKALAALAELRTSDEATTPISIPLVLQPPPGISKDSPIWRFLTGDPNAMAAAASKNPGYWESRGRPANGRPTIGGFEQKPDGSFGPTASMQPANMNGGLLSFFANGGMQTEKHVAQIAPAGATRVWREPETGGEAYIPMALGKRSRSLSVLDAVAARFNARVVKFAGGGMLNWSRGYGDPADPRNQNKPIDWRLQQWRDQNFRWGRGDLVGIQSSGDQEWDAWNLQRLAQFGNKERTFSLLDIVRGIQANHIANLPEGIDKRAMTAGGVPSSTAARYSKPQRRPQQQHAGVVNDHGPVPDSYHKPITLSDDGGPSFGAKEGTTVINYYGSNDPRRSAYFLHRQMRKQRYLQGITKEI